MRADHAVNRRNRGVLSAACAAALLIVSGCDPLGIGHDTFIVRVDSITAPQSTGADDALVVVFHGYVGPDGCSRVARIERQLTAGALDITFHGERDEYGECTQMVVELQHRELVPPPHTDPFVIRAIQPRGPALEKTVEIR